MRIAVDERFHLEVERFVLLSTCEHCVYFERAFERCANGYPNAMHRDAAFARGGVGAPMFCKEFELE